MLSAGLSAMQVGVQDIIEARTRIQSIVYDTPVLQSKFFNELVGNEVFFKCENFQEVGAFKIRGAYNFIAKLLEQDPSLRQRGVVTISSGNHAQGVAYSCKVLAIPATVYMPSDAPLTKIEATKSYGAKVELFDRFTVTRESLIKHCTEDLDATFIPSYDHPDIIAGQGTVACELLEEHPDVSVIVSPLCGGGLLSGIAIAAKSINHEIEIYGVEPESGNDWFLSLQAGKRVRIDPPQTIADGLSLQTPGEITFPIVQKYISEVILVSDEEIINAMKFLLHRLKIVVEPSGAVGVAALMAGKLPELKNRKIGVVISGGNADPGLLKKLLYE